MMNQNSSKILVALDYADRQSALQFVEKLTPNLCRLKVGKELFSVSGPEFIKELIDRGFDVFLDLKYHDIPNTVAKAIQATAKLGVWMVNVHALGGRKMMEAAREALSNCEHKPLLIAVTVLTSMEQSDLNEIGLQGTPEENVLRLANLAQTAGMDGIVCSAQEVARLRQTFDANFCLVTPGIRPEGSRNDDQKRIMTPKKAMEAGSSFLVIGRPITQSDDPVATLTSINNSL